MKKTIISLCVITALTLIAAPYFTGKAAESMTENMISKINQSPDKYGTTEITSYDRQAYSSSTNIKHTLPAFLTEGKKDISLDYHCDNTHRIWGITYECKIIGNEDYTKFITESFNGKDPISIFGSINILGHIEETLQVDAFELQEDDATINVTKSSMTFNSDKDLEKISLKGHSDGINTSFSRDNKTLTFGKMDIDSELVKSPSGLWFGNATLSLNSLEAKKNGSTTWLKGLRISSNTQESGDTSSSKSTIIIDEAQNQSSQYKHLENATLSINTQGLNTQALVDFQTFYNKMQQEAFDALESGQEPNFAPEQAVEIIPIIENMLVAGLNIDFGLSGKIDGHPSDIKLDIKLLDKLSMSDIMTATYAPEEFIKKIELSLSTEIAKEMLDTEPMAAARLENNPLIRANGDSYSLDLKLAKTISLNGKEMSFQEFQNVLMSNAMN